ncbi:MAG: acetyl-CoA acetyltransferase [Actinomycetota bacterium]|nr:acetyl-CoA acetyltransferase [Actinomycetota bacterium]
MIRQHSVRGAAAVVGVADAVSPDGVLQGSLRALEVQVIREALESAGLSLADVDGLATCTGGMMMPSVELAEYLGVSPVWTDSTQTGGSSFEIHVEHAAAAIASGACEVVVIVYAQTPKSTFKRGGARFLGGLPSGGADIDQVPRVEWEIPYGIQLPIGAYSLAASRHMAQYGTTSEQLAQIAVSTREWATLNPNASLRGPITIEDVLASPMTASPLHKLDCCLVTDGAGAIVMTSAERARDLRQRPAYVLGAGTAHSHSMISQMPDLTVTAGRESGAKAFAAARLGPGDVDVAQLYDSFTITVLLALEDLGFCGKGEGGSFVEDGRLGPGGSFPAQTSGGGLAYTHPGMFGMFLLVEAVRQLQGSCGPRQVPGAEVAVAHGCGGVLSATSTIILGTEATL